MSLPLNQIDELPAAPPRREDTGRPGRRIRLVYVIDNMGIGGTELNAVRTAERLDRDVYDLRVACMRPDGPLRERYRALGVPVVPLPMRNLYGVSMLRSGLRFASYLRSEAVQIVHAHDIYSNVFATVWARVAGVPAVIASRRWAHALPARKFRWTNAAAFHAAHAVLANSAHVARGVVERDNVPPGKVWTVTNFADDEAFAPLTGEERAALRGVWGIPPDATVIGCVARLAPVKDHATLIAAFAALRPTRSDLHLVLVGDGECRNELESLAKKLGVQGAVTFTGELRGGGNPHRLFDISALASRSEGFPNSVVEAMAAGVAVVATAVGGVPDAVAEGETGMLVPPGEADALAAALGRLADDAILRHAMGASGRRRAWQKFRASAVIGELRTMYDALLARGPA